MTNKPLRKEFSSEWFKGLVTASEKDALAAQVMSAEPTLRLLADLLRARRDKLDKTYDYNQPNWQFAIAKDLGAKEELDHLLKLLTPILKD